MDEQAVIQRLLEVEKNASKIVEDAAAKAASSIAENEKECRTHFDDVYGKTYSEFEAAYKQQTELIHQHYQTELDAYRSRLSAQTLNQERFSALAREFLFGLQKEYAGRRNLGG